MLFPILNRIFNSFLFYLGWVLCLHSASLGKSDNYSYGVWAVVAIIAYQFYRAPYKGSVLVLISAALLLGSLSDSLYLYLKLLRYQSQSTMIGLLPFWLYPLWGLFGVNVPIFDWLENKWTLAALLGALGGPFSYWSAVQIGAAEFLLPQSLVLIIIGTLWTIYLPFFIWLNQFLNFRLDYTR